MKISSPSFKHMTDIPRKHTCQGWNANPELNIEDIPKEAKSLALIMDDPDAPGGSWTHWIVYNIPVSNKIEQNSVPGKQLMNSFGKRDYGGPCPPSGLKHRYFFRLFALKAEFDPDPSINRATFENILHPYILDKAELVGFYKKF